MQPRPLGANVWLPVESVVAADVQGSMSAIQWRVIPE